MTTLYTIIGLGIISATGYLIAWGRSYYVRGKRGALKFVSGLPKVDSRIYEDWSSDTGAFQAFKEDVYKRALISISGPINDDLFEAKNNLNALEEKIINLQSRRDHLINSLSQEVDISIDDNFYSERDTRIKTDIQNIDEEIKQLQEALGELKDKQIDRAPDKIKFYEKISERWYATILQNINLFSKKISASSVALVLLATDYGIAVSFFYDVAKDIQQGVLQFILGFIVPLAITLIMMWLAHIAIDNIRVFSARNWHRISGPDLMGLSLPLTAVAIIAAVILIFRLMGADTPLEQLREILLWLLFVTFVGVVAHEITKPSNKISINALVQPPVLLVLNAMGGILLIPIWIAESVYRQIKILLSGLAPTSEKEAQLHKRLRELTETKNAKVSEIDEIGKERKSYTSSEIKRIQEEHIAKIQLEINDIDKQIENIQKEITVKRGSIKKLSQNIRDLKSGSDDGVISSLRVRLQKEIAMDRREKKDKK